MVLTIINTIIAAATIGFCTWLAGKRSDLAGFITAMPITTLIALALTHQRWQDPAITFNYAKSTLYALPISLLFFLPFLLAEKLQLSFWMIYFLGLTLLTVGYFIHKVFVG